MNTETTTALDELDRLAQEIEDAKQRLDALTQKKRSSQQELTDALRAFRAYSRDIEAGSSDPDTEQERELREAIKRAQEKVAPQEAFNPRAGIGEIKPMKLVNPELEGRLDGARERLAAAERDYTRFRARHFDDLVVELGVLGSEYVERYELAAKHAARAAKEWRALRNRWRPVVEVASFDWKDFPRSPFEGVELEPLMPRQLAKGEPVRGPSPPMRRKRASS